MVTPDVSQPEPTPQPESAPAPEPHPPHPPASNDPLAFLTAAPIGTRVVARTRIPGGFSDALGYLRSRDEIGCTIEARRGLVTVLFADLIAAKAVPPPPERRAPR